MDAPAVVMRRIRDGDKTAEQELFNHFWRPLYFIILRQSRNPTLAQDITQDAMIIVLEKARNNLIDNPDAIASFIRKVGESVLITHYRKEKRRQTSTSDEMDIVWPDAASDIANKISQQQLVNVVQQVMDELPIERDRKLLVAYFLNGQGKEEICDALELTSEHFDRVLHRAKQRLKQQLSLKFKVDLSADSLSSLLAIALLSVCSGFALQTTEQFSDSARELHQSTHLVMVLPAQSSKFDLLTKVLRE